MIYIMRFCLKLKVENVEQSTFFYKLIDSVFACLIYYVIIIKGIYFLDEVGW